MVSIDPRKGALRDTGEALDATRPVVMVNLLSFREQADYVDGTECSGIDAYRTYAGFTLELVRQRGGETVYYGNARGMLIAPEGEHWDQVLLVRYPDFAAFVSMIKSEEYQKISYHRTAALHDSRLYATQEI